MRFKKVNNTYLLIGTYVVLSFGVIFYLNGLMPSDPIENDAAQNLRMAYHIYKEGVMSNEHEVTGRPTKPTSYREPVPPFVTAVFMAIHPSINKNTSLASLQNGENTSRIKKVNLFWILLLIIGSGLLTYYLTNNRYLPFFTFFLVLLYFIRFGGHLTTLYTELPAAVFVIWTSLFLLHSVQREKLIFYFTAGLFFGLLILTKSVFYYLSAPILIILLVIVWPQKKFGKVGWFLAGIVILVVPYLIRNYIQFKELSLTQRGGVVLYQRAVLNQMTNEEVKGAIFLWGPALYKDIVQNTNLGADERDFESGGKFVRINRDVENGPDSLAIEQGRPDLAESLFNQVRAEINMIQRDLGEQGKEGSREEAYNIMKEKAKRMILAKPFRHLGLSPIFMWRGMWCFPNSTLPFLSERIQKYVNNIINLIAYISLFSLFISGFIKKEKKYLAVTMLPVFMLLFHMLFTHNVPRLSDPAIPSMLVCLCVMMSLGLQKLFETKLFPISAKK